MTGQWPIAEVDQIARLRALAAGVSGATVVERVVPAQFDAVWALLSDFEGGFGLIEPDMRRVRVAARDGAHIELAARSRWGMRARLAGTHRPGWLWVQSRFLLIGVAAVPRPDGRTRVACTGGVRVPGRAALVPIGVRRAARHVLDRLERRLGGPAG
jgi:hypothetical protein